MKTMLSQIHLFLLTICLCGFATISCNKQFQSDDSVTEFTIAFGSCSHQWEDQPMWAPIVQNSPDLWIWLGDIIYADTEDMDKMSYNYYYQKNNKQYKVLTNQTEVIGIWDDHDYGANNAGKEYAKKDSSKLLLFDFLDVPADHSSRERPGAYQSYTYVQSNLTIKVILLDVRYFRDEPSPDGTILGTEQWSWFEGELSDSPADIHIIGGGIQFLPEDHPYEKWANFPMERARLLKTMDAYNVKNPILISGDRHIAEMSVVKTPKGTQLIEITSSGLTHSYSGFKGEENRHRMGSVTSEKNFGVLRIQKKQGSVTYKAEIKDSDDKVQTSFNSEVKALQNIDL